MSVLEMVCSVITIDDESEEIKYRERIVRCRDCKKWGGENRFFGKCTGPSGRPDQDGFCSWGERRDS